jgi:hypothetical protein
VFGWSGVEPCSGWQQGESRYPITHRAVDGAVPLILRGIDAGDLDRGSKQFGQDDRKRSPHSCLQECLNADDTANWGVLLSGDRLRLLHDTPSLVKPAYLAADLELMIEGERFDSCTSGLALPPTAHRTAQSESSQEAQPLVHRLINAALGPSAEQRHRVLGYWSGGGSLWLSLQRRQPMGSHVQPAQGGAVEQVKGQRGSLEPEDPGGDPNHQAAGIHEA